MYAPYEIHMCVCVCVSRTEIAVSWNCRYVAAASAAACLILNAEDATA